MNKNQLAILAQKYLDGSATEREKQLLNEWYDAAEGESLPGANDPSLFSAEEVRSRMLNRLMDTVNMDISEVPVSRTVSSPGNIFRLSAVKWVAAASVALILLTTTLYFSRTGAQQTVPLFTPKPQPVADAVILPGGNKAKLVLSNGEVVILEDVANGVIKNKNGLEISKQNGKLTFRALQQKNNPEVTYNTVYTPRGGEYQVLLPDGSRVWLNAASSLKFPGAFAGASREVELTGEGYFEIAKNPGQTFRVSVNNMKVEVLGTHFNIMSYDDEGEVNTTLLEGAVKITEGQQTHFLKPGQQASLNKKADRIHISDVDVEQAVAWKNGLFRFDGITLESVMKQLARWYNIKVEYKGHFSASHFRGMISRNVDLMQVTRMLEMTSDLHFKVEDQTVTVSP